LVGKVPVFLGMVPHTGTGVFSPGRAKQAAMNTFGFLGFSMLLVFGNIMSYADGVAGMAGVAGRGPTGLRVLLYHWIVTNLPPLLM
jgi:hypothetical protein